MKNSTFLFLYIAFIFSCNNAKKSEYVSAEEKEHTQTHPGKKLMETNCYNCHSPSASEADRIGPPMIAIKKHYISSDTSKEEFINAMQTWIKNPNAEDAKMFGSVKRFGVMPKQSFPEETIKQIADYMFDNNIEQPEWFEAHFNGEKGMGKGHGHGNSKQKGMQKQQAKYNFEELPYAERGLKYALSTKAVLGKNLMGAIQKDGTLEALSFCNERAYPLTDSMSVVHKARIKRVTDKPRNPKNQANAEELEYIKTFKQRVAEGEEPSPIVTKLEDKVQVFYPITTNTMCLQCHGNPRETVESAIIKKLATLYPKDKAIGYGVDEVRGIWSVTFDK